MACSVPSYKLAVHCVETLLVPVARSWDTEVEQILVPQQGALFESRRTLQWLAGAPEPAAEVGAGCAASIVEEGFRWESVGTAEAVGIDQSGAVVETVETVELVQDVDIVEKPGQTERTEGTAHYQALARG